MEWLEQNWFWAPIFVVFIGVCLFWIILIVVFFCLFIPVSRKAARVFFASLLFTCCPSLTRKRTGIMICKIIKRVSRHEDFIAGTNSVPPAMAEA